MVGQSVVAGRTDLYRESRKFGSPQLPSRYGPARPDAEDCVKFRSSGAKDGTSSAGEAGTRLAGA
jgi:hypothetical protein